VSASCRLALLAAVTLLAVLASCAVGAIAARAQHDRRVFFGTVSDHAFAADTDAQAAYLTEQSAAGVRVLRQAFRWQDLEPEPGLFMLRDTDRFVLAAAIHGIDVLPVLFGEPSWATSRPPANMSRSAFAPRRASMLAPLARLVAERYGPRGTLWAEHPAAPRRPVTHVQVWNEPNTDAYWGDRPDAHEYAAMLRAVAGALRAGGVRVLAAGLPTSRHGVKPSVYLRALLRAGARRHLDAIAAHPYAASIEGVLRQVAGLRAVLPASMRATALWVTELGWGTGGPRASGRTVDPAAQARLVQAAMLSLWRVRHSHRVAGVIYYAWRDAPVHPGGRDYWGLYTGLVAADGSPKPALAAFAQAARLGGR
jgi:hypothetical protein